MTLKTVDMENCNKKERCLSGPNAGLAYTPGDECAPNFAFNEATCDCDITCPQCELGNPADTEQCNYRWTDERGLTYVGITSYGEPLISGPYGCGSTYCYFDLFYRQCDGSYSTTPTPSIGYCSGSGCAADGVQLTGPTADCYGNTCSDVLCPAVNENFDCDTCDCVVDPCACTGNRLVIWWKALYKERNTSCVDQSNTRYCQGYGGSELNTTVTVPGLILGQEGEWIDNYDISDTYPGSCPGPNMRGALKLKVCNNGEIVDFYYQLGFPGCTVNGGSRGIHEYIIGGNRRFTIGNPSGNCP